MLDDRKLITDDAVGAVAALLADATRLGMLWALADGRARPAGELARHARIGASTASEHLARLLAGGLVVAERHGRHRYFRIAGEEVVHALEAIGALAQPAGTARDFRQAAAARSIRHARACYDHLAGTLGVAVTRSLQERRVLVLLDDRFDVPADAEPFFSDVLGVDVARARATRRQFARVCLDLTERVPHVAGALGAALLTRFLETGWLERTEDSRALRISASGRRAFRSVLGIDALERAQVAG